MTATFETRHKRIILDITESTANCVGQQRAVKPRERAGRADAAFGRVAAESRDYTFLQRGRFRCSCEHARSAVVADRL